MYIVDTLHSLVPLTFPPLMVLSSQYEHQCFFFSTVQSEVLCAIIREVLCVLEQAK